MQLYTTVSFVSYLYQWLTSGNQIFKSAQTADNANILKNNRCVSSINKQVEHDFKCFPYWLKSKKDFACNVDKTELVLFIAF